MPSTPVTASKLQRRTSMSLGTLGAQRFAPRLNIGCGHDVREGWTNLDGFAEGPGIVKHDFLDTPWPFPNGTFEHIEARYVVEHIPVMMREHKGTQRDVIFDFFEEAHRVLKMGGTFEMYLPWAFTEPCHDHIQHYRSFLPNTFDVLTPNAGDNYYTGVRFEVAEWERSYRLIHAPHKWRWRMGKSKLGLTEHIMVRFPWTKRILAKPAELRIVLRKLPAVDRSADL